MGLSPSLDNSKNRKCQVQGTTNESSLLGDRYDTYCKYQVLITTNNE